MMSGLHYLPHLLRCQLPSLFVNRAYVYASASCQIYKNGIVEVVHQRPPVSASARVSSQLQDGTKIVKQKLRALLIKIPFWRCRQGRRSPTPQVKALGVGP